MKDLFWVEKVWLAFINVHQYSDLLAIHEVLFLDGGQTHFGGTVLAARRLFRNAGCPYMLVTVQNVNEALLFLNLNHLTTTAALQHPHLHPTTKVQLRLPHLHHQPLLYVNKHTFLLLESRTQKLHGFKVVPQERAVHKAERNANAVLRHW